MVHYEQAIYEVRDEAAWFTLNRPEAMNSLTEKVMTELDDALHRAEQDQAARTFVITGAGRAFCAGADLKDMQSKAADDFAATQRAAMDRIALVLDHLESTPLPTIAAVNGLALAGGLELVLCCDLVIAAESARFGDAHANFGLLPGGGSSIRLPRLIGVARAKYMLYTGEFLPAAELHAAGLVNRVVPDAELHASVAQLTASLANKSPLGLRHMKQLVALGQELSLEQGLAAERDAFIAYSDSHDMREGLAAFREKRRPRFNGS